MGQADQISVGVWQRFGRALSFPCDSQALARDALLEVERRAMYGSFVYLACWVGIAVSTGVSRSEPMMFWVVTAVLSGLLVLRMLLHVLFKPLVARHHRAARFCLVSLVLGAGLVFGLVALKTIVDPLMEPMKYPMVLVCGVLCTAATLIMSIDPVIRYGMPMVMLVPFSLGIVVDGSSVHLTLAMLLGVNVVYLVNASRYTHQDYWSGAKGRSQLQDQAALFEAMSLTDALTGLPNRLSLEQRLNQAWLSACASRQPLSIMLIDIDHFKAINDQHGHPFGDECLRAVARALQLSVQRASDFVARYGGEEFLVIMPAVQPEGVVAMAERMRSAVAELRMTTQAGSLAITCSIGIAVARPWETAESLPEAVDAADKALYGAKQAGRDRVMLWSSAMAGGQLGRSC